MDIFFLEPIYKDYIWGGNKLKKEFNKNAANDIIAESWEISTNKNGKSIIKNGEFQGKDLQELFEMQECRKKIFGEKCINMSKFPLLIKFIDAKRNLSVQVHPNDEYAEKYEKDSGKSEMWYIIDCPENAKIVCGFKSNITKENLREMVENKKTKDNLKYLDIEKGDSIYIPSGTVHSILADTLVCEIQQNSDLTYRIYDWDRVDKNGKSRELHIDKAIDVIDLESQPKKVKSSNEKIAKIVDSKYFKVEKVMIDDEYQGSSNEETFYAINVIEGEGKIYTNNKEYQLNKGDSFIIPSELGEYKIIGKLVTLVSYI